MESLVKLMHPIVSDMIKDTYDFINLEPHCVVAGRTVIRLIDGENKDDWALIAAMSSEQLLSNENTKETIRSMVPYVTIRPVITITNTVSILDGIYGIYCKTHWKEDPDTDNFMYKLCTYISSMFYKYARSDMCYDVSIKTPNLNMKTIAHYLNTNSNLFIVTPNRFCIESINKVTQHKTVFDEQIFYDVKQISNNKLILELDEYIGAMDTSLTTHMELSIDELNDPKNEYDIVLSMDNNYSLYKKISKLRKAYFKKHPIPLIPVTSEDQMKELINPMELL